jgi:aldehyde:ferredoxin oxidoreductase
MAEFGYAGEILKIDLSSRKVKREDTSHYSSKFIGGKGLAAKIYWDMVPPDARALSPENALIFATGPTTTFQGIAGCRWQVSGKSPMHEPEAFSTGNMGGKWGPALKAAGFDALVVSGKADRPVYIYIRDGEIQIKDASALIGKSSFDTIDDLRTELGQDISVVTIGPGGEHEVVYATAFADEGASGGAGMGAVMGSKNLKAIAVAGSQVIAAAEPARLEKIKERAKYFRGPPPDPNAPNPWAFGGVTFNEECWGCGLYCNRQMYFAEKGRKYKAFCQQTGIYTPAVMKHYGEWKPAQLLALRLCDANTLDSAVMAPMIKWMLDCYKEGVMGEKETGLPLSQLGTEEFIEKLTHMIAFREGFGDALARGLKYAAQSLGKKAEEIALRYVATRSYECQDYDPRLFFTTSIFYATEPRRAIDQLHGCSILMMKWLAWYNKMPGSLCSTENMTEAARRYWGSETAADFSTWEGKALAAKKIQDRCFAKDSLILCDLMWPMMITGVAEEAVGDPSMESQIYSAITGHETDEAGLARFGERIACLQRAIHLRQGWGGRSNDLLLDYFFEEPLKQGAIFFNPDAILPGPKGKTISKLGTVVERDKFEQIKTDFYKLRGWDTATGYPTKATLTDLGLEDVAADLEKRNLVA